jgi:lysophospholipase L1-like esterase
MIGDSTMANKIKPDINPEFGWGQVFHEFFTDQITIYNYAANGKSSKSFINEGKWDSVLVQIGPGDYVLIQFGHNDKKEFDRKQFTNSVTFRKNLEKFVKESKKKGAKPIILSPIVERHFNDRGSLIETHGIYPIVSRLVAKDQLIPFIDLKSITKKLINDMGPEKSKSLYLFVKPGESELYPEGREDSSHLSYAGAKIVAKMVCEELRIQVPDLVKYLK